MSVKSEVDKKICSLDDALEIAGYGKYSVVMLVTCCLLILAMYVDMFGFSVMLPPLACDLELTTAQEGLLSAAPLIGVMVSSYVWGLFADTMGRRASLLLAMPIGMFLNIAASFAPSYVLLTILRFLSACFTSSANAAAFVLLAESLPSKYRSRNMFLMATVTTLVQLLVCSFAIPIFKLTFRVEMSWLSLVYRPWRLVMLAVCLPGVLGCGLITFMKESPKYLLCRGKEAEAIAVLKSMYRNNRGLDEDEFPVKQVFLEDEVVSTDANISVLHRMLNQTVPLFKPPLLANSMKLYYLQLCAFVTSTGYTMWVPTMTNAYFDGNDVTGKTFCEVASSATAFTNTTVSTDCDDTIQPMALYATMIYSLVSGLLTIVLSFVVGPLGKKTITLLVFFVTALSGFLLLFLRIPILSIIMFYMFLYVALILGNVNAYLVELNPTHLRGMATSLSVIVARGFGFVSVQVIGALVADHCTPLLAVYVGLVASGFLVSLLLPAERKKETTHL